MGVICAVTQAATVATTSHNAARTILRRGPPPRQTPADRYAGPTPLGAGPPHQPPANPPL